MPSNAVSGCGGYDGEPGKIFADGSMTGVCAPDDSVSMTKATNGIVVLTGGPGRVQRGQLVLLEAFGGGFTWGSALLRY